MARVPVRGGPHDGGDAARRGQFRWLDERGGHRAPGPGRTLYRLRARPERYEHVGNARYCLLCEVVVGRRKEDPPGRCPMCGGPTDPTTQLKEEQVDGRQENR